LSALSGGFPLRLQASLDPWTQPDDKGAFTDALSASAVLNDYACPRSEVP
jgi:hypothetical protein